MKGIIEIQLEFSLQHKSTSAHHLNSRFLWVPQLFLSSTPNEIWKSFQDWATLSFFEGSHNILPSPMCTFKMSLFGKCFTSLRAHILIIEIWSHHPYLYPAWSAYRLSSYYGPKPTKHTNKWLCQCKKNTMSVYNKRVDMLNDHLPVIVGLGR